MPTTQETVIPAPTKPQRLPPAHWTASCPALNPLVEGRRTAHLAPSVSGTQGPASSTWCDMGKESTSPLARTGSKTALIKAVSGVAFHSLYLQPVLLCYGLLPGNYIRYDLNMPKHLPKRKGGPQDFTKDSPLTVQGHFQASLVGQSGFSFHLWTHST